MEDYVDELEERINDLESEDQTKAIERKIVKLRTEQEEVQEALNEVQNAVDYLSDYSD